MELPEFNELVCLPYFAGSIGFRRGGHPQSLIGCYPCPLNPGNSGAFFVAKYDEQSKLSVVQSYEQGTQGLKFVARRYGLDRGLVRRWVKAYQQHELLGLRKKFSHYLAEFKLSVLHRMQQEELSARQAIALCNLLVSSAAIAHWQRRYH